MSPARGQSYHRPLSVRCRRCGSYIWSLVADEAVKERRDGHGNTHQTAKVKCDRGHEWFTSHPDAIRAYLREVEARKAAVAQ